MSSSEKACGVIPMGESCGLEALFETCALAGAFAQVVQAGAADFVMPFHDYLGDAWRVVEEGAFHADTVAGYAADGECGIISRATRVEHNALELLNTFAVAFLNFVVHADRVPWEKIGDLRVLFGFDRFKQFGIVHVSFLFYTNFHSAHSGLPDGAKG